MTAFRRFSVAVVGLIGWLIVDSARADVRPALKARIPRNGLVAADSGQEYEGTIELTSRRARSIEGLEIAGEGWEVLDIDPANSFNIDAGETVDLTYRAIPADADKPLRLTYLLNGQRRSHTFNVGPNRIARLDKPFPSASAHPPIAVQNADVEPGEKGEGSVAGDAITLRVKGRIVYWRPGDPPNAPVGVDSITFRIIDEDTISDETMYSGLTNADGTFDVTFQWDDCDITGCDDPDIYIEYETDSGVVNVQDTDLFETD